jgi:hypothetical protein
LTSIEKAWIGLQIAKKKDRAENLAIKYNLKLKTLYNYAIMIKKHNLPREKRGRPKAIDEHGCLEATYRLHEILRPANSHIYNVLQSEHINTVDRRSINLDKSTVKVMSARTVLRYKRLVL